MALQPMGTAPTTEGVARGLLCVAFLLRSVHVQIAQDPKATSVVNRRKLSNNNTLTFQAKLGAPGAVVVDEVAIPLAPVAANGDALESPQSWRHVVVLVAERGPTVAPIQLRCTGVMEGTKGGGSYEVSSISSYQPPTDDALSLDIRRRSGGDAPSEMPRAFSSQLVREGILGDMIKGTVSYEVLPLSFANTNDKLVLIAPLMRIIDVRVAPRLPVVAEFLKRVVGASGGDPLAREGGSDDLGNHQSLESVIWLVWQLSRPDRMTPAAVDDAARRLRGLPQASAHCHQESKDIAEMAVEEIRRVTRSKEISRRSGTTSDPVAQSTLPASAARYTELAKAHPSHIYELVASAARVLATFADAMPFGATLVEVVGSTVEALQNMRKIPNELRGYLIRRFKVFLSVLSQEHVVNAIVDAGTLPLLEDCIQAIRDCNTSLEEYCASGKIARFVFATSTRKSLEEQFEEVLCTLTQLHEMVSLHHIGLQSVASHNQQPAVVEAPPTVIIEAQPPVPTRAEVAQELRNLYKDRCVRPYVEPTLSIKRQRGGQPFFGGCLAERIAESASTIKVEGGVGCGKTAYLATSTIKVEGGVGCGKTAYLAWLCHTQLEHLPPALFLDLSDAWHFFSKESQPITRGWLLRDVVLRHANEETKRMIMRYTGPMLWVVDSLDEVASLFRKSSDFAHFIAELCGAPQAGRNVLLKDWSLVATRKEHPPFVAIGGGVGNVELFPESSCTNVAMHPWTSGHCRKFFGQLHQGPSPRVECMNRSGMERMLPLIGSDALGTLAWSPIACCVLAELFRPTGDAEGEAHRLQHAGAKLSILDILEQMLRKLHASQPPGTHPSAVQNVANFEHFAVRLGGLIHTRWCSSSDPLEQESDEVRAFRSVVRVCFPGEARVKSHDLVLSYFVAVYLRRRLSAAWEKHEHEAWTASTDATVPGNVRQTIRSALKGFVSFRVESIARSSSVLVLLALMIRANLPMFRGLLQVLVDEVYSLYKRNHDDLPKRDTLHDCVERAIVGCQQFGLSVLAEVAAVFPTGPMLMLKWLRDKFVVIFKSPRAFHLMLYDAVRLKHAEMFDAVLHLAENGLARGGPAQDVVTGLCSAVCFEMAPISSDDAKLFHALLKKRNPAMQHSLGWLILSEDTDGFERAMRSTVSWPNSEDALRCFRICIAHGNVETVGMRSMVILRAMSMANAAKALGMLRHMHVDGALLREASKFTLKNFAALLPGICQNDSAMRWLEDNATTFPEPLPHVHTLVVDMPDTGENDMFNECMQTFCNLLPRLSVSQLSLSFVSPVKSGCKFSDGRCVFDVLGQRCAESKIDLTVEVEPGDEDQVRSLLERHLSPHSIVVIRRHENTEAIDLDGSLWKIVVFGEGSCGKTCLIRRYVHGIFQAKIRATIGVDFARKIVAIKGARAKPSDHHHKAVTIQIWDICGQERYGQMTRVYYRYALGAVVVCDATRPETLRMAKLWIADFDTKTNRRMPKVLVVNKWDLFGGTLEEIRQLVDMLDVVAWFPVSAKDNLNVDVAFNELLLAIHQSSLT